MGDPTYLRVGTLTAARSTTGAAAGARRPVSLFGRQQRRRPVLAHPRSRRPPQPLGRRQQRSPRPLSIRAAVAARLPPPPPPTPPATPPPAGAGPATDRRRRAGTDHHRQPATAGGPGSGPVSDSWRRAWPLPTSSATPAHPLGIGRFRTLPTATPTRCRAASTGPKRQVAQPGDRNRCTRSPALRAGCTGLVGECGDIRHLTPVVRWRTHQLCKNL